MTRLVLGSRNDLSRDGKTSRQRISTVLVPCAALFMAALTPGCAVVTLVGTAATLTATAAATVVEAGVGAAKVTGKVIGKGVDVVTSSPSRP